MCIMVSGIVCLLEGCRGEEPDLAGLSAILKVTDEAAAGSASASAGAYMQNLGRRKSDSNT